MTKRKGCTISEEDKINPINKKKKKKIINKDNKPLDPKEPDPKEPFKIYRRSVALSDDINEDNPNTKNVWRTCTGEDANRCPDSYVHCYSRCTRFLRVDHAEEAGDEKIRAARTMILAFGDGQIKSHAQRVDNFSYFELYCLVHHGESYWSKWLLSLKSNDNFIDRVVFMAPTCGLVTAYATHLRYKKKHKGGTIRVYIGAISATCREFGVEDSPTSEIKPQVVDWENTDGNASAPSFNFVQEMPRLFAACWSMIGWQNDKKIQCWTMFLIAMSIFARASDLTIYCPLIEDMELPPERLWDCDGYPQWIELGLRDWKWRSTHNKGKRYGLRLHRNYVDARFCPVTWLLFWLSHKKLTKGPIFQKPNGKYMTETMWTGMTDRLFLATSLYDPETKEGCTNHSIRRTGVQWAGRCWLNPIDAKNTGRWKTMQEMGKYFGQGSVDKEKAMEGAMHDPILSMWVWKPNTVASFDGRDMM